MSPSGKAAYQKAYRAANVEKLRRQRAAFYSANAERLRAEKAASYAQDPAKFRAHKRRYAERNAEKLRARKAKYYQANASRLREAATRKYYASRDLILSRAAARYAKDAEKARAEAKRKRVLYASAIRARNVLRKLAKACRTPTWADRKQIEKVYEQARVMSGMLGESWHVDHVIPLRGKTVSGLHVHENLQILPARENIRKGSKVVGD